jgi:hypothetical protein
MLEADGGSADRKYSFYRKGEHAMGGWRSKIIFLLVVYFAGFATAIYCLAPVPENYAASSGQKSFLDSAFKSDDFAKSFNTGIHKCLDFAKDAAQRAGKFAKQKMDERQTKS